MYLSLLGAISLLIASVIAESSDIFYWPVGSPQPSLLARVAYDPASLKSELLSYHPPTSSSTDDLVRIGLYTATPSNPKQWSGSLVSLSALTGDGQPTIRLHLGPAHELYHVSLASMSGKTSGPQVQLVSNEPGTQPHLNRPVVVSPDGSNPEDVPEKTFFQKYWWVLLIVTFLTMSGGGGGEGQ
ncbi:hypothetical protein N7520_001804 [Penicillium odoratum]|uniref:uncharacterized protein n=1 Tax=Penicillium odoratum TaxID=1167516 RepID=UPI00254966A5|nr:uncharacterized protein N7520_001804 [Penicillium odoratum]KAJ5778558.1 hypothetical protein N7520_001804 [Penicillium odoratum]